MLEKPQEQTSMQEKTENMQQRRKKWLFSEPIPIWEIVATGTTMYQNISKGIS